MNRNINEGGASAASSASAARHFSHDGPNPALEWGWAQNIALDCDPADPRVTVLIGTHGQVPIRQDGSFMPHTVQWDATMYPGTVCGIQSTIFGQVNFMADEHANPVAALLMHPIDLKSDNAMVDFAERLKRADTGMPEMARDGVKYLDGVTQRYDPEMQTLPLLASARPTVMESLRYAAFRYEPTGVNDTATNRVSLLNKEFLIDRASESKDARKTHNEWHINIFYKDIHGKMKKVDLFPLLVSKGHPISKSRTGLVSECKVTNMQNIVDALHVARFSDICIVDLTCFVFRQPLNIDDTWTLEGDNFSRILKNMMDRYKFKLVKKGSVRPSLPGYSTFTQTDIDAIKADYVRLVQAVKMRDSAAVDGPRSAMQLREIADAEIKRKLLLLKRKQRRRRKTRKRGVVKLVLKTSKPAKTRGAMTATGSTVATAAMATVKVKKKSKKTARVKSKFSTVDPMMGSNSDSPIGSDSDSSMDSNSDSSIGSPFDSPPDAEPHEMPDGGRRRITRKMQKRHLRRRRGSRNLSTIY
jgi:hypothetical protein